MGAMQAHCAPGISMVFLLLCDTLDSGFVTNGARDFLGYFSTDFLNPSTSIVLNLWCRVTELSFYIV